ncbi:MAG: hypothetical protein PSX36_08605 [bacterium]|nr:hypothetical protein [bacterium]
MKKIIIQTIVFLSPMISFGQENIKSLEIKRNSIYFEVFGQGLYNSFSFDRLYNIDKKIKTSFTAGLTIIPHPELFVLAAPISYNFIFGQKNHHVEFGIGFTAMYLRQGRISASEGYIDNNGILQTNDFVGHSNDFYSFFTPKVGYRFQKSAGGIFFRATLTPPIAGVNKIGGVKGGKYNSDWSYTEYFTGAAFFGYRAFPWAGLSIGWTLKK